MNTKLRRYEIELDRKSKYLKSKSFSTNNYSKAVEIREEYQKLRNKFEFIKKILNIMEV